MAKSVPEVAAAEGVKRSNENEEKRNRATKAIALGFRSFCIGFAPLMINARQTNSKTHRLFEARMHQKWGS